MTDETAAPVPETFPWDGPAPRSLFRLSVWPDAAIKPVRYEYDDQEPIQSVEITDETGVQTDIALGHDPAHELRLAEAFIAAFTEIRDHARRTIAARESA
jgi:hypothetical protein